ncbi:MAG: hypothetical protein EOO60_04740 [Hymenobacter sp.]|nr:MAG: hypothetical protein EOO60_04740 [Hymenobacter sp.]
MLHQQEIGSSANRLSFLVPQVGREISLRFERLSDFQEDLSTSSGPLLKGKPLTYQVGTAIIEVLAHDGVAVVYTSLEDVKAIRKHVYFFPHKGGYYGYTLLSQQACTSFLASYHTEPFQPDFVLAKDDQVLRVTGHGYLWIHPYGSAAKRAYLYSTYEDMALEERLVREFTTKCNEWDRS